MAYRLSADNLRPLLARAAKEGRRLREICGVIVDVGPLLWLVEIRNVARRPLGFVVHGGEGAAAERAAKRLGLTVAGTFHSHVVSAPVPGRADIHGATTGDLMLIIDSIDASVRLWRIGRGKARPVAHTILPPTPRRRSRSSSRTSRRRRAS